MHYNIQWIQIKVCQLKNLSSIWSALSHNLWAFLLLIIIISRGLRDKVHQGTPTILKQVRVNIEIMWPENHWDAVCHDQSEGGGGVYAISICVQRRRWCSWWYATRRGRCSCCDRSNRSKTKQGDKQFYHRLIETQRKCTLKENNTFRIYYNLTTLGKLP